MDEPAVTDARLVRCPGAGHGNRQTGRGRSRTLGKSGADVQAVSRWPLGFGALPQPPPERPQPANEQPHAPGPVPLPAPDPMPDSCTSRTWAASLHHHPPATHDHTHHTPTHLRLSLAWLQQYHTAPLGPATDRPQQARFGAGRPSARSLDRGWGLSLASGRPGSGRRSVRGLIWGVLRYGRLGFSRS